MCVLLVQCIWEYRDIDNLKQTRGEAMESF